MVKKRSASLEEQNGVDMISYDAQNKEIKVENKNFVKDQSDIEMGDFEDPWEDEMEEEEVIDEEVQDLPDGEDYDFDQLKEQEEQEEKVQKKVYLPGQELQEGETLEFDNRAYRMYHTLNSEWPCLSFDILQDQFGNDRTAFPMSLYMTAGSQADNSNNNRVYLMKVSRLHKTYSGKAVGDDSDSDEDDDYEIEEDPLIEFRTIKHFGGVNRIRAAPTQDPSVQFAATWADTGKVHVWDLSPLKQSLDTIGSKPLDQNASPVYTLKAHKCEGFAMDWCPKSSNPKLLTGDCNGNIYLTSLESGKGWNTGKQSFSSHKQSVEDLQWSPNQETVFASSSCDQTIMLWDTRAGQKSQITIKAHDSDVNVISWSKKMSNLLASGDDNGQFKIWDLRQAKSGQSSATYEWHKKPITSIQWSHHDESILAVSSADNQLTIWDFSVEADDEAMQESTEFDIPPQLLFIHQGQQDIKELHWHKQIPGVVLSTASTGFDIFKAISME